MSAGTNVHMHKMLHFLTVIEKVELSCDKKHDLLSVLHKGTTEISSSACIFPPVYVCYLRL